MCGITGLWSPTKNLPHSGELLKNMTAQLVHRGPDATNIWLADNNGPAFGHRRLAILDLSPDGVQPMHSPSGRYTLSYNGEFYNFKELRAELKYSSYSFKGYSDTEVFLHAIDYWGLKNTLEKVRGMFAFALWDRQEQSLHLVRDRLGKKPLYVGWAGNDLVFASELKAFFVHPSFEKTVDEKSQALYFKYGYIPAPHTIFNQVWQLPPGHQMTLTAPQPDSGTNLSDSFLPYWSLNQIGQKDFWNRDQPDEQYMIEQFHTLLSDCTVERMAADVPLGAFLSGGLDSSLIVALMQAHSEQAVKTFTIGFQEPGFNEAAHAKEIADHLATDHHELYLSGSQVREVIPKIPEIYDEPFADISAIPTYLISHFARKSVTVALSGDGGDETTGGYQRYLSAPGLWNNIKNLPLPLRRTLSALMTSLSPECWNKLHPAHPQFGQRLYKAAGLMESSSQQDMFERILSSNANAHGFLNNPQLHNVFDQSGLWDNPELSFEERMMMSDAQFYLPHDILTKLDRASMAVSLEVRSPLLDRRIFEFVWSLPLSTKIRQNQGKWLLRQVLKDYVPEHLFERPKQGFNVPIGTFLRKELREWAEALLSPERLQQNGLHAEPINKIWHEHLNQKGSHATMLWTVLMYQAWNEHWC